MTLDGAPDTTEFDTRTCANQHGPAAEFRPAYDFIVCGSGSSGFVVARRPAESAEASVLLLEAGGTDDLECVNDPGQWFLNLKTERDWGFEAQASPHLN